MPEKNYQIGLAVTGSFCTYEKIKKIIRKMQEREMEILPIFSDHARSMDSRFGKAEDFLEEIEKITGKRGIRTIQEAEPIGPKSLLDALVIAPCTGNTMAKLCNGIIDTPVLMAAKAHLRNEKPLILAVSTNDALGINFKNLGMLANMKHIYFVPFGQDDCGKKPNSMVAHMELIPETVEEALKGRQIQPMIRCFEEKRPT